MTTMRAEDIEALAVRVEAATGADRVLDCLIYMAVNSIPDVCGRRLVEEDESPAYTASIDAAMSLLPTDGSMNVLDVNFTWEPGAPNIWPAASIRWYPPHKSGDNWHALTVGAKTLPLTIVAAALRARAHAIRERG